MDLGSNIRDFLVSRRARVRPDDVGLPVHGRPRRVAGLRHLAVASEGARRLVRSRPRRRVAEQTQWLLDAMRDVPAFVRNGRLDILASNALGQLGIRTTDRYPHNNLRQGES